MIYNFYDNLFKIAIGSQRTNQDQGARDQEMNDRIIRHLVGLEIILI